MQNNDFTLDFWCLVERFVRSHNLFGIGKYTDSTGFSVGISEYSDGLIGVWQSGNNYAKAPSATIPLNQWFHFALVKHNGKFTIYQNGTAVTGLTNITIGEINGNSEGLTLGNEPGELTNGHVGKFDEVRFSDIARWTTDFTPPSAPYSK